MRTTPYVQLKDEDIASDSTRCRPVAKHSKLWLLAVLSTCLIAGAVYAEILGILASTITVGSVTFAAIAPSGASYVANQTDSAPGASALRVEVNNIRVTNRGYALQASFCDTQWRLSVGSRVVQGQVSGTQHLSHDVAVPLRCVHVEPGSQTTSLATTVSLTDLVAAGVTAAQTNGTTPVTLSLSFRSVFGRVYGLPLLYLPSLTLPGASVGGQLRAALIEGTVGAIHGAKQHVEVTSRRVLLNGEARNDDGSASGGDSGPTTVPEAGDATAKRSRRTQGGTGTGTAASAEATRVWKAYETGLSLSVAPLLTKLARDKLGRPFADTTIEVTGAWGAMTGRWDLLSNGQVPNAASTQRRRRMQDAAANSNDPSAPFRGVQGKFRWDEGRLDVVLQSASTLLHDLTSELKAGALAAVLNTAMDATRCGIKVSAASLGLPPVSDDVAEALVTGLRQALGLVDVAAGGEARVEMDTSGLLLASDLHVACLTPGHAVCDVTMGVLRGLSDEDTANSHADLNGPYARMGSDNIGSSSGSTDPWCSGHSCTVPIRVGLSVGLPAHPALRTPSCMGRGHRPTGPTTSTTRRSNSATFHLTLEPKTFTSTYPSSSAEAVLGTVVAYSGPSADLFRDVLTSAGGLIDMIGPSFELSATVTTLIGSQWRKGTAADDGRSFTAAPADVGRLTGLWSQTTYGTIQASVRSGQAYPLRADLSLSVSSKGLGQCLQHVLREYGLLQLAQHEVAYTAVPGALKGGLVQLRLDVDGTRVAHLSSPLRVVTRHWQVVEEPLQTNEASIASTRAVYP